MQDGIRRAGWNFQEVHLIKMHAGWKKFPKLIKCAGWNKGVQVGIFQKINKLCCTFIR